MNNPYHICDSFETIFWGKILKFFGADPGSEMEKIRIQDKHLGSATMLKILGFKTKTVAEYGCELLIIRQHLVHKCGRFN
jgi:hypothetical protein